jgi:polyhydroxyalkanoate synthesis regulator phasin
MSETSPTPPENEETAPDGGVADSVRAAVERTMRATAGSAATTRERAAGLVDEVARLGRDARDELARRGEEAGAELARRGREATGEVGRRLEALERRLGELERRLGESEVEVEETREVQPKPKPEAEA